MSQSKKTGGTPVRQNEYIEFDPDSRGAATSGRALGGTAAQAEVKIETAVAASSFPELDEVELPVLDLENRGRLLVQSPNRLFFYWTLKNDPLQDAGQAIAGAGVDYRLMLKLIDLDAGSEAAVPIGSEGNWWFDVEADKEYRAEIGLVSASRPYIRILYSNTVRTPRRAPSRSTASSEQWAVPAEKFSRLLKAAGYERDAFDVAAAGDDPEHAETAAKEAFTELFGSLDTTGVSAEELRLALFMTASGASPEDLEITLGPKLSELFSNSADRPDPETAGRVLSEYFDVESVEGSETPAEVYGASKINFPRKLRKRIGLPKFVNVGSDSFIAK